MSAELQAKFPDVDPFLLKKWDKVFHKFFDVNDNKTVEWGDFYVVQRHCREIYGADSAQVTYAKNALGSLWDGLVALADKNKDSKIEIEEWVAVLRHTDPKTEPKWFIDYLMFMFKLFDVSADDLLDLAEYTDGMVAYGLDSHAAMNCFHKFAVDKSGKAKHSLNANEFKELWNQYFYSTDPNALGNWLFGPL